ncbi:excalibur calcium-binding domain-containing protein [Haemophilus influenzae]|nr:excalibur calcium-binding domain-containing protein [Haemophilus influenzae]
MKKLLLILTALSLAVSPAVFAKAHKKSNSESEQQFSCNDGKRVCGDMESCDDAMFHLKQCGMKKLDRDRDGVPCESMCQ